MKRLHGILLAALALAATLPADVSAQQVFRTGSRGMLGIRHVPVEGSTRQHVVLEVIAESPAQRAGLTAGDTILRINGLAASVQVMNAPFEPGDTVVLRVKRGGRERDVRIVAAERPGSANTFTYVLPDSVMGRVSILMDAMKAQVDTLHFSGNVRLRMVGPDSAFEYHIGTDSLGLRRVYRNGVMIGSDSARIFLGRDSLFEFAPGFRGMIELDSVRTHVLRAMEGMPRIIADSMFMELGNGDRVIRFGGGRDSVFFTRPGEIFANGMTIGMRAVAGAELSELNEGLSEYFGATSGVLVLNAREGTPAARAGLRSGDVILRANGNEVKSISDLRRAIDGSRAGAAVRLQVQRRGARVDVTLSRE